MHSGAGLEGLLAWWTFVQLFLHALDVGLESSRRFIKANILLVHLLAVRAIELVALELHLLNLEPFFILLLLLVLLSKLPGNSL